MLAGQGLPASTAAVDDAPANYVIFFPERGDRPSADSMDTLARFEAEVQRFPRYDPVICYVPSSDPELEARRARWLADRLVALGALSEVIEDEDCVGAGAITPPDSETLIGYALQLSPPDAAAGD